MSFFALVLAAFAIALLAGATGHERRPDRPVAALAVAAPTLLLIGLFAALLAGAVNAGRFDGLRIGLEGVSVDLKALKDHPLTIGGDRVGDALVVAGLPPSAARIGLDASGQPVVTAATEGGKLVELDGRDVATAAPLAAASERLTLYRSEAEDPGRERLVEKRSLSLAVRDGRLQILFDTPSYQRILGPRLAQAIELGRQAGKDAVTLAFSGAAAGSGAQGASSLPFAVIGAPLRADLYGRIELSNARQGFTVADVRGPRTIAFGQRFELGGDWAALARVDRIDLGWSAWRHLAWLPAAALLLALVGTWTLRRRSTAAFLVLSLLDLLLLLRLVIGAEAAFAADGLRVDQSVRDALFALIAAPFAAAALDDRDVDRSIRIGHGLVALAAILALTFATAIDSATPIHGIGVTGILCTLLVLAGLVRLAAPSGLYAGLTAALPRPRIPAAAAREQLDRARAWIADPIQVFAPIALLAALGVLRMALALVGVREALHLPGVRIPLSAVYTPASLVLFAWALVRISRPDARSAPYARFAVPALWAAWALALLAAPLVIHDSGYFVTNAGPFLLWGALAAVAASGLSRLDRIVLAAPAVVAVIGYAALSLNAVFAAPTPDRIARAAEAPTSAEAHATLARYAAEAGNLLRLEAVFDPEALSSRGSASAERDRAVIAHRAVYADTLAGRGWLSLDRPTLLEKTQLDDDLGEIHLLSPFGRSGGAALLAIEGLIAALATWTVLRRRNGDLAALPIGTALGLLALWTVFFVSAYMLLGVVELLPFTGRDIYLLAAASPSDLVEGLLLLGLAYALIRREEDACRA